MNTEGEITYFRKKLIGGFNRDDVAAYIAALAKERNDAAEAAQNAQKENERLREIISGYEKLIEKLKMNVKTAEPPAPQPETQQPETPPQHETPPLPGTLQQPETPPLPGTLQPETPPLPGTLQPETPQQPAQQNPLPLHTEPPPPVSQKITKPVIIIKRKRPKGTSDMK